MGCCIGCIEFAGFSIWIFTGWSFVNAHLMSLFTLPVAWSVIVHFTLSVVDIPPDIMFVSFHSIPSGLVLIIEPPIMVPSGIMWPPPMFICICAGAPLIVMASDLFLSGALSKWDRKGSILDTVALCVLSTANSFE